MQMEPWRGAGKRTIPWAMALSIASSALALEDRCQPKTLDEWRTRCVADRSSIREALPEVRRSRTFSEVGTGNEACRILAGATGDCGAARAELLAVLLNVGDGLLRPSCCVRAGDDVLTLTELIRRADHALTDGGSAADCGSMSRSLGRVNDGSALVDCGGGSDRDRGTAVQDAHSGPGAERGRGHVEHGQGLGLGHEKSHGGDSQADGGPDDHGDDSARCCDPRSAAAWARACRLRDRWAATVDTLDDDTRRELGTGACEALVSDDTSPCAQARRELVALRVNIRSGRLAPSCAIEGAETAAGVLRRAAAMRRAGDCAGAAGLARGVNTGQDALGTSPCEPGDGRHADASWEAERPRPEHARDGDEAAGRPLAEDDGSDQGKAKGRKEKDKGKGSRGKGPKD